MATATERAGANSSVAKLADRNHSMARITVRYLWMYWLCAAVLLDPTHGDEEFMCVDDTYFNKSCIEIKNETKHQGDQFVQIKLKSDTYVLCDTQGPAGDGGWFVIQRREDDGVDFYRNWEEYKYGFGDLHGSFWLGNEMIHWLTTQYQMELRIDMKYNDQWSYVHYKHFKVASEEENYRMQLSEYDGNGSWIPMAYHNDTYFSTYDMENDLHCELNCAQLYKGGWWYKTCHKANLNGVFGSKIYGQGINFLGLTNHYDSLDYVIMKLRVYTN